MAHTMPFTAEMRYKLASVVSFSSMALNSPRLALTNYHFFINSFLEFSENYGFAGQKRMGKHTNMKITFW